MESNTHKQMDDPLEKFPNCGVLWEETEVSPLQDKQRVKSNKQMGGRIRTANDSDLREQTKNGLFWASR